MFNNYMILGIYLNSMNGLPWTKINDISETCIPIKLFTKHIKHVLTHSRYYVHVYFIIIFGIFKCMLKSQPKKYISWAARKIFVVIHKRMKVISDHKEVNSKYLGLQAFSSLFSLTYHWVLAQLVSKSCATNV